MLSAARRSSPRLSPVSRPIRTRKGGVLAPLSLGLCAVAVVGYTVAALALPTTAGDAVAPEAVAAPVAAVEEGTNVQVTELTVAGPAAGAGSDPGSPNRVGSEQVTVRSYAPAGEPWATLVWAHGGSFVHGTLDWPEADWVSRSFAEAGLQIYSVDYVLASERVKAPAPGNDVAAVVAWAAERTAGPLVVGGGSAGAHLATLAALAQADAAAAGAGRPSDALILEYPTLHRVQEARPEIAAVTAALPEQRRFAPERIADMYDFYLGDAAEASAAGAVVAGELPAERLALLPATVIVNADADDLRASGERFAAQLREAGVIVSESVQPGTVHGYLNRPEESDRARDDARETIGTFVAELRRLLAV